ncbi:MAG: prenylated flavin chaperone LpdD [Candidatus Hodarchaeales archaeon]
MVFIRDISEFELREGRIELNFRFFEMGNDIVCLVAGGKTHLGAASISEVYHKSGNTRASTSTLSVHGHQDGIVTSKMAESLTKKLHCNVITVVGIHIDNITRDEIRNVLSLCETAVTKFVSSYSKS